MDSKTGKLLAMHRTTLIRMVSDIGRHLEDDDVWRALSALESVGMAAGGIDSYAWKARHEELQSALAANPAHVLKSKLEAALAALPVDDPVMIDALDALTVWPHAERRESIAHRIAALDPIIAQPQHVEPPAPGQGVDDTMSAGVEPGPLPELRGNDLATAAALSILSQLSPLTDGATGKDDDQPAAPDQQSHVSAFEINGPEPNSTKVPLEATSDTAGPMDANPLTASDPVVDSVETEAPTTEVVALEAELPVDIAAEIAGNLPQHDSAENWTGTVGNEVPLDDDSDESWAPVANDELEAEVVVIRREPLTASLLEQRLARMDQDSVALVRNADSAVLDEPAPGPGAFLKRSLRLRQRTSDQEPVWTKTKEAGEASQAEIFVEPEKPASHLPTEQPEREAQVEIVRTSPTMANATPRAAENVPAEPALEQSILPANNEKDTSAETPVRISHTLYSAGRPASFEIVPEEASVAIVKPGSPLPWRPTVKNSTEATPETRFLKALNGD